MQHLNYFIYQYIAADLHVNTYKNKYIPIIINFAIYKNIQKFFAHFTRKIKITIYNHIDPPHAKGDENNYCRYKYAAFHF